MPALVLAAVSATIPLPSQAQSSGGTFFPRNDLDVRAAAPLIVVVNRKAVIDNSVAARRLSELERQIRERVQSELDRVRAELEAEERALTELKSDLDPEEFESRTLTFDRRVRSERRAAQERGALLLRFVQDSRGTLTAALPRVIDALRREIGAMLVVDSSAVVVGDAALDVTAAAIIRFDSEMSGVVFDPPAALLEP